MSKIVASSIATVTTSIQSEMPIQEALKFAIVM